MNQKIYIAYGITKKNEPVAICWHPNESACRSFGIAGASQSGIKFVGVSPCESAPILSRTSPDQAENLTDLMVDAVKKLVHYISGLSPDLREDEVAKLAAFFIHSLPEVLDQAKLRDLAESIRQKRQSANTPKKDSDRN